MFKFMVLHDKLRFENIQMFQSDGIPFQISDEAVLHPSWKESIKHIFGIFILIALN